MESLSPTSLELCRDGMGWSREEAPFANGYTNSIARGDGLDWAVCAVTKSWVRRKAEL